MALLNKNINKIHNIEEAERDSSSNCISRAGNVFLKITLSTLSSLPVKSYIMDTFPPMMLGPFTWNNGHSVCDVHHKSNKLALCLPFRDGLRLAETVSAPSSCFPFSTPAANHTIQTSLSHCLLLSFAKLYLHNVTPTCFPHPRLQCCTLFEDSLSRLSLCCKVANKLHVGEVKYLNVASTKL